MGVSRLRASVSNLRRFPAPAIAGQDHSLLEHFLQVRTVIHDARRRTIGVCLLGGQNGNR
jgi:hypothetical protein